LINNTSKEQIELVRERGQNFIHSEEFKETWSSEAVNKFLYNLIFEQILSYENQANNRF
jgi:GH18 family chitinase